MKTLDEYMTPEVWDLAVQRAYELGRQQGWNEAIEAAENAMDETERDGKAAQLIWKKDARETIRALKCWNFKCTDEMPTQEKAEA
jgi:hypothetical protein